MSRFEDVAAGVARCPRCDRAECEAMRNYRDGYLKARPSVYRCDGPAVDWRARCRALAAEHAAALERVQEAGEHFGLIPPAGASSLQILDLLWEQAQGFYDACDAATELGLNVDGDMALTLRQVAEQRAEHAAEVEALRFRLDFLETAGTEENGWCEHERRYQRTSGGDGDHCYVCEVEALTKERDEFKRAHVLQARETLKGLDMARELSSALTASRAEASRLRAGLQQVGCQRSGAFKSCNGGCFVCSALSAPAPGEEAPTTSGVPTTTKLVVAHRPQCAVTRGTGLCTCALLCPRCGGSGLVCATCGAGACRCPATGAMPTDVGPGPVRGLKACPDCEAPPK